MAEVVYKNILDVFNRINDTQMECKICSHKIKFITSKDHSSSLRNHVINKHTDVYQMVMGTSDESHSKILKLDRWAIKNNDDFPADIPFLDRQAIASVAGKHVLPFDIVEDPIFRWAYPHQVKDRHTIAKRVSSLASEWRVEIGAQFKGKFLSLSLDGWTNNVSKNHHFCVMVHDGPTVIFWKSQVMVDLHNQAIKILVESVIDEIKMYGGIVIATVADNARNVQLALMKITQEQKGILQVRCIAHIINLMQGDVFRRVNVAKQALKDVECFIEDGEVGRYVVTRWNSRFVAIKNALSKELGSNHIRGRWEQTSKIFNPLAEQQIVLQKDNSTVIDVIRGFLKIRTSWKQDVSIPMQTRKILLKIWSTRWEMFLDSSYGSAVKCAKHFIFDWSDEEMDLFMLQTQLELNLYRDWCFARVQSNMKDELDAEFNRYKQHRVFGIQISKGTFSILETCADLLTHIIVSEAAVERAFSRHRLIHTRFRTRLHSGRLEDSLFVCYNFKIMLKLSTQVAENCLVIDPEVHLDIDDIAIADIEYEDAIKITDDDDLVDEELDIEVL